MLSTYSIRRRRIEGAVYGLQERSPGPTELDAALQSCGTARAAMTGKPICRDAEWEPRCSGQADSWYWRVNPRPGVTRESGRRQSWVASLSIGSGVTSGDGRDGQLIAGAIDGAHKNGVPRAVRPVYSGQWMGGGRRLGSPWCAVLLDRPYLTRGMRVSG